MANAQPTVVVHSAMIMVVHTVTNILIYRALVVMVVENFLVNGVVTMAGVDGIMVAIVIIMFVM